MVPRLLHPCTLLVALLLATDAHPAPRGLPAAVAQVALPGPRQEAQRLLAAFVSGDAATSRELLEWSAHVGPAGVSALFEELQERLDERRNLAAVAALERALSSVPALALDSVTSLGDVPAAEAYRVAGLSVLARLDGADDPALAFSLSATAGDDPASSAALEALEVALIGIFQRAPRRLDHVREYAATIDFSQKSRLIRAIGNLPSSRAFSALGELLDDESFHATVLSRMGRIATGMGPVSETRAIARVRDLLRSAEPRVRHEAVLTLGKLEDEASLANLIELLDDADERLASNAHWALMRISGRNFRPEARRWEAWHAAELQWWVERAPDLLGMLASERAGDVATAINELATHRLFRHAIARELRPLLTDRRNDIVLLSCTALTYMGSATGLSELVDALAHRDPRIRACALTALQSITSLDLGPEPAPWRAALERDF